MSEKAFDATKSVMGMFGAFFKAVAQEIGMDRAFGLLSETFDGLGAMAGKMTKEQMGLEKLDVDTASSIYNGICEVYGISPEIEKSPTKAVFRCSKCSFYEGLQSAGIDHETNRSFCNKGLAVMVNSLVENLDPTAVYNFTKFRSEPYDFCEEEIIIKK